jgi:hypothetical protein
MNLESQCHQNLSLFKERLEDIIKSQQFDSKDCIHRDDMCVICQTMIVNQLVDILHMDSCLTGHDQLNKNRINFFYLRVFFFFFLSFLSRSTVLFLTV